MSFTGLFLQPDIMVQMVMVGLLSASVCAWIIIFEKWNLVRHVQRNAKEFEDMFLANSSPKQLYERLQTRTNDPMIVLYAIPCAICADYECGIKRIPRA